MNELFDKEVNAQKESLKKSSGAHVSSRRPMRKCAMKMKGAENSCHGYQTTSGQRFLIH